MATLLLGGAGVALCGVAIVARPVLGLLALPLGAIAVTCGMAALRRSRSRIAMVGTGVGALALAAPIAGGIWVVLAINGAG